MTGLTSTIRKSFLGVSSLHALGLPLLLLSNIILARLLSVEEFGVFTFIISMLTVVAIPVSGGLPMLLTREIAGYVANKNWGAYRAIFYRSHAWVAAMTVFFALAGSAWAFSSRDNIDLPLIVAVVLLPIIGFSSVRSGILKGLGRPGLSEIPKQLLQPALLILGFLLLGSFGFGSVNYALLVYLGSAVFVFLLGSAILVRVQPKGSLTTKSDASDLPRWRKSIVPFTLLAAATTISAQIGVILVGVLGTAEDVAQISVAQRGAQLVVFPLMIMNTIIGPFFVKALLSSDRGELGAVTRHAARLTLLLTVPLGLVLLLFGPTLLRVTFGAPYDSQAFIPMAIIIIAQLISVALGSGGILLSMSGHERHTLYSQLLSLIIIGVVSAILVGRYGAAGAALGVASGIIAAKIYAFVMVRRLLSVSPAIF